MIGGAWGWVAGGVVSAGLFGAGLIAGLTYGQARVEAVSAQIERDMLGAQHRATLSALARRGELEALASSLERRLSTRATARRERTESAMVVIDERPDTSWDGCRLRDAERMRSLTED